MRESYPLEDSPIAAQLRKAGAVILGKANLSEWANFHSTVSSSGWSGLGGQTKNPYDLSKNPCGSSSGSAVAVASNLCVLAIGTETEGSIVCPANNNGIVGIKPTIGLISRRGIIPISFSHDTGGPLARTVKDATICLGTLTAVDSLDSKTLAPGRIAYKDYTQFLNSDGIAGKKIGFWKTPLNGHSRMIEVMDKTVEFFESYGATIIELDQIVAQEVSDHSYNVMFYEFKDGINRYLRNLGSAAQVKDLEDLINKTFSDSIEMEYHDHELFITAQSKGNLDSEDYRKSLETMLQLSRAKGIDKIMDEYDLDAIIAPAGGPAWKTDLINGDSFGVYSAWPAAIAGYPNIVVPMGQVDGLPVGLSIFGRAWSEPSLLEIAYSYEQGNNKRVTPKYIDGE
jgi:amidase